MLGLLGIFNMCLERPVKRTIISSMVQLLDGLYADRKEFANIDAIGSSFLYHAVSAGAVADAVSAGAVADAVADGAVADGAVADGAVADGAGAAGGGAVGSDIWTHR